MEAADTVKVFSSTRTKTDIVDSGSTEGNMETVLTSSMLQRSSLLDPGLKEK